MALKLPLQKAGDKSPKLMLPLGKGKIFTIELSWDSKQDLDAHALVATNDGNGAKVTRLEQVLTTYNTKKNNPDGVMITAPNGSFATPCGALRHSGDCRDGTATDVDETITFDSTKAASGVNEVPIFVTIHEAEKSKATFAQVSKAGIRIKDSTGNTLHEYQLTDEFAPFTAVQMGSLILGANGWEFAPVGSGFNGDFMTVLGHFS